MADLQSPHRQEFLSVLNGVKIPDESLIKQQQLRAVFSESTLLGPVSFLSTLIVAAILVNQQNSEKIIFWLIAALIISLADIIMRWNFSLAEKKPFSTDYWERCFLLIQLSIGCYWGYAGYFLLPNQVSITPLLVAVTVGGLLVYASTLLTMNLKSFMYFALPPLIAIIIQGLLSHDETSRFVRIIHFLFGLFLVYSAYMNARHRKHALINMLNNRALIAHFEESKQRAEKTNLQLKNEVNRRRLTERALKGAQTELEAKVIERTQDLTQSNELLNQQISLRKKMSDALIKSQTRLSQAIEASQLELWDWDLHAGKIHQSSSTFDLANYSNLSTSEFLNKSKEQIHPNDFPATKEALIDYLQGKTNTYQVKYRLKTKLGDWCWVEDHGKAIDRDSQGRVTRIIGTRRNINAEYKKEEQLRLAKSVIDNASEGIFILDADFKFVSVNQAWLDMMNLKEEDIQEKTLKEVSNTPQKSEVFAQAWNVATESGFWEAEIFEKQHQGDYFPMWFRLNRILSPNGKISHYAGLTHDLSDRKQADEKLNYLLNYDDLTGMANRAQLLDRLHQALISVRNQNHQFALLIVNIDRFKHINESVGHKNGDLILQELSHRIKSALPHANVIARLGNDEFAVLLDTASRDIIANYADQLLNRLTAPFLVNEQTLSISCSMGIVRCPQNSKDLQILLHQADMAVRQAKYLGGMNYQFYIDELQAFSQYRISIESELRKAVQNDELEVFYQPKMSVSSGMIVSVEALVRWRHPQKGLISPSEFVHIAEESGLITDIGYKVLMKSCIQGRAWLDAGLGKIKMSVNLSAHQLRQQSIIKNIMSALENSGLDSRQLELELTESALMEDHIKVVEQLKKLSALGIDLAIDDFGTGYSSLSYLKLFPVDALKIDQSFIIDLCNANEDAAIVKAIIVLGQSLKLSVIAEGVENEEQLSMLKMLGCDYVQGYLISPPLSAIEMTLLLKKQLTTPYRHNLN
jgi:diguanylate cyclase (GGDEF)-like protein/PAS domain S-box-containing protein